MKRISTLLFIVSGLVLASCAKEEFAPKNEQNSVKTTISVNLPDELKTALGAKNLTKYPILWSTGDVLTLNGVASSPLSSEFNGQRNASFEFEGTFTAPYNIVYGAKTGSGDIITFKSNQAYVKDSFDPASAPLYSASASSYATATLSPLNAILKFAITSSEAAEIKTIIISAKGGELIAGDFKLGKTNEGLLNGTVTPTSGSTAAVSLDLGADGVTLGTDPTAFCVAIPAITYSNGLTAYIVNTAGETMEISFWGTGKTVSAGIVYELSSTEFVANSETNVILTATQLASFLGQSTDTSVEAILGADIDLTDAGWVSKNKFYGVLDGAGHTISGLTTPLFGDLYGVVKNLKIDANVVYTGKNGTYGSGTDYGVGILCHYIYNGKREDVAVTNVTISGSLTVTGPTSSSHAFHIAGIAGASNGVPVTNCINKANITLGNGYSVAAHTSGDTEFNVNVAGIVGMAQSAKTCNVIDCTNEGTITANPSAVGEVLSVGGVVGRTSYSSAVRNCVNKGDIIIPSTAGYTKSPNFGGVIGYAVAIVEDCVNEGDVKVSGTCGANVNVGGVAGFVSSLSKAMTNNGNVIVDGLQCTYLFVGGAQGYNNTATIYGLKNNGTVTIKNVKNTAGTGIAIGGILAQASAKTHALSDCENTGDVIIESMASGATAGRYDIGGVLAYDYTKVAGGVHTFTNLKNSGDVLVKTISTTNNGRVGGIVGNLYNANESGSTTTNSATFTSCENTGDVIVTAGAAKVLQVGGIVADSRVEGAASFTSCTNRGKVNVNGYAGTDATTSGLCMGGIVGKCFYSISGQTLAFTDCVNEGQIGLFEATTDSYRPTAGGIIGLFASSSQTVAPVLTIKNCVNSGNVERVLTGVTKQTLARTGSDYYKLATFGGGIAGSVGYFYNGGTDYTYQDAVIENCTNNGTIAFNRKPSLGSTYSVEKNCDGENVYCGGIAGCTYSKSSIVIKSCTNNGPILNTCGKDGGIVGIQRSHTAITGTKDAYTVNNGRVHFQGATIAAGSGAPYGYCGGITGYLFGDGTNSIEYAANYGHYGSNYGGGGIVGALASTSSYNVKYIRYCKVFCECKSSSTAAALMNGGKTALFTATAPYSAENYDVYENVSDIAVGGAVYKYIGSAWSKVTITADNYFNYLSAITHQPTQSECTTKNIVYWDGTSKTAWE